MDHGSDNNKPRATFTCRKGGNLYESRRMGTKRIYIGRIGLWNGVPKQAHDWMCYKETCVANKYKYFI